MPAPRSHASDLTGYRLYRRHPCPRTASYHASCITVVQFTPDLQSTYLAALSAADGVPVARHRIANYTAGSVVVAVLITPDPLDLAAPSPASVVSILAAQAVSSTSVLSNSLKSVAPVDATYTPVIATVTQYTCADGSFAASASACPKAPARAEPKNSGAAGVSARINAAAALAAMLCIVLALMQC